MEQMEKLMENAGTKEEQEERKNKLIEKLQVNNENSDKK
jgi:hypothetical protein